MTAALALGTVQFGLRYGVANRTGQVSSDEATQILTHAWNSGLDTLDTAVAYGESEQRLGEIGVDRWRVISKLPPLAEGNKDAEKWVRESIEDSLERLRIPALGGLLLHRSADLLGPQGDALYRGLLAAKDAGKAQKIGVSIYDPAELDLLWPHFKLDLVQAPFNIVDRRLASSGWLKRLYEANTEVHVRSVFLQGLLLMTPADRPARFARWQTLWDHWYRWLDESSLTPLQACLGFVLSQSEISRAVVGVDRQSQLQEILDSVLRNRVTPPVALTCSDYDLINPLSWIAN